MDSTSTFPTEGFGYRVGPAESMEGSRRERMGIKGGGGKGRRQL
jgi:hypothetical protein